MRKSNIEQSAVAKAMALLNDPKIKLVRYRTDLILALLKHEHQRRSLADAREHRKHEIEVLKLKKEIASLDDAPEPEQPASGAVTAAREFLARLNGQGKGAPE